jgi:hypothetical protein
MKALGVAVLSAGLLACAGGAGERTPRAPSTAGRETRAREPVEGTRTAEGARTAEPAEGTRAAGPAAPDPAGGALDDPILGRWVPASPEEQRGCRAGGTRYVITREAGGLALHATWSGGIGIFERVLRGDMAGEALHFEGAARPGAAVERVELRLDLATGTLAGTWDGRPVRLYRPIPDPPDCPPAA